MKFTDLQHFEHIILVSFNKKLSDMYISYDDYKTGKYGICFEMDKQGNHTFFLIIRMNLNGLLMEFSYLFDIFKMDEYENYNNFEEMMDDIQGSNVMKQDIFENNFKLFESEIP